MKPPSFYVAFGYKRAIYLKALSRCWERSLAAARDALARHDPLHEGLVHAYHAVVSIDFSGKRNSPEYFVIATVVVEAAKDTAIRNGAAKGLQMIQSRFEIHFHTAPKRGKLAPDADPAALALLASAKMHSIETGARRAELRDTARKAVNTILGSRQHVDRAGLHLPMLSSLPREGGDGSAVESAGP
ncbi:TetR/AcrR family transcriptional regulator [Bradyrhizobium sp. CB2312]|uniref:TetR/AcrR family transcriptional regulator n=1 Tax=Bradyrhizobium sp. CB2312 TaxID=3039155 RepID=UPI0024B26489|nr:TetR/AcrR family transcriptional regulator [Bradyrhizobium sp. CB2312]WFU73397.1 TetR/AcrR family transcriptional regulator [Bradyrhizobium sp. CB2312]